MPDDLNMNQKLENILNVSLDATEDELRKADSLSTGYNWRDNTWEIIVKSVSYTHLTLPTICSV